ncbi:MAG: sorbosone dehydrogenase family protein [Acidobacteriota bacterium]
MPASATIGPAPTLVKPQKRLIPDVNVVTAIGWNEVETPVAAPGTRVQAFARELDHPRWLYVLPNGDVLVAETNAPPRPDDAKGIKGWFFAHYQRKAGGDSPSANRLVLLRDQDGDGVADTKSVFLTGLNSPFGMALVGDELYIANTDAIVRVPYTPGTTAITARLATVLDLPGGALNHHWTKNILASADGQRLYVAIGSNSNAGENGLAAERNRAELWELDLNTRQHRTFATGLRNPVGMAWEPETGALWVAVNERDELGPDLVPDYMTAVVEGGFYGWPFSYYGAHVDTRVAPPRPDLVAKALVPDYALGAHTASLGLASAAGSELGAAFAHGMFVGQHGSWNRTPRSGYKVVFVPFTKGTPSGAPLEVLGGFVRENGEAMGRPVGVAVARGGGLLVADDIGNTVWLVSASSRQTQR